MRSALVRRSVLTASAVSLTLLATACGSDKADTKADAKPSGAATSAAPAAKGKTDAELAPLLITQAEAPEYIEAKDAAKKTAAAGQTGTADKPECKVLLDVMGQQKVGAPTGVANTALGAKPKEAAPNASEEEKLEAIKNAFSITTTLTGLSSYDGKGAAEALASVKTAGQACAGGFTVTDGKDSTKFESVKPGEAVSLGDEAVSLTLTLDLEDGDKSTVLLTLVRKADTVASFASISLAGQAVSPKTLIEAQVKKLG
ncbi:sensor domain-containing protein [Streptomyces sp. cmx-4-9]|uniref:sensor domain-containing protein n=1 Tax=Streptomyces sp. cmx-4-9 TaxID=2790941 RepID=UPI00397F02D6